MQIRYAHLAQTLFTLALILSSLKCCHYFYHIDQFSTVFVRSPRVKVLFLNWVLITIEIRKDCAKTSKLQILQG